MTDEHAEEKREKVTIKNLTDHPITITSEYDSRMVPDRVFFVQAPGERISFEYIRMDEHERLIREAKAGVLDELVRVADTMGKGIGKPVEYSTGYFSDLAKQIREGKA